MESVWWVFSQLFKKNFVYRGVKVMPFSTGCSTPLSNFEAGQNYQDVVDPSGFFWSFLKDQLKSFSSFCRFPPCWKFEALFCCLDYNSLDFTQQFSFMCKSESCLCCYFGFVLIYFSWAFCCRLGEFWDTRTSRTVSQNQTRNRGMRLNYPKISLKPQ